MSFSAKPQTVLQYDHVENGKSLGSISASIFVSETGDPKSNWKVAPIYRAATYVGEDSSRLEGYVESVPGQFCSIVLTYRSKSGNLSPTWGLNDDIIAFYYLDGRTHPVMTYNINHPGAKNPLPLTGLWLDDFTRCPLRWDPRQGEPGFSEQPYEELFFPEAPPAGPAHTKQQLPFFKPPLASIDDLASFRVTIHRRSEVESPRNRKSKTKAILPRNAHLPEHDVNRYVHETLSESIGLKVEPGTQDQAIHSLFHTYSPLPKSKPIVEFRIFYKSRPILEEMHIALPPVIETSSKKRKARSRVEASLADMDLTSAAPVTSATASAVRVDAYTKERQRRGQFTTQASTSTPAQDAFDSNVVEPSSTLPPAGASNAVAANDSRSNGDSGSQKRPREPGSRPFAGSTNGRTSAEASFRQETQAQQDAPVTQATSGQPPAKRVKREAIEPQLHTETSTSAPEPSQPVPERAPMSNQPSFASVDSSREEHLSFVSGSGSASASPGPSQIDRVIASQSMPRSSSNLAVSKEEQAREFLEELDIADEENVQALLSVGFKSKNRFLKTLPNLAEEDRKEILDELKAAMGRVDFLVLSKYLSRYC